jgi:hypothetical protein
MPWRAVIVSKTRDTEGRLSVGIEYRDGVEVKKSNTFQFDRGTTFQNARAQIRAFGILEEQKRDTVEQLDTRLALNDEIAL